MSLSLLGYPPVMTVVMQDRTCQYKYTTAATRFYLGIRDETLCVFVDRVLVFYYVCPAETSDLIIRPERIALFIGNSYSAPILVDGECVENSSPATCSQNGVWGGIDGAGCVCDTGFQQSLDGRSRVGMFLSACLSIHLPLVLFFPLRSCQCHCRSDHRPQAIHTVCGDGES